MATYTCQNCSHSQSASDQHIGKSAKCKRCRTKNKIVADAQASNVPPTIPIVEAPETVENSGFNDVDTNSAIEPLKPATRSKGFWDYLIASILGLLLVNSFAITGMLASQILGVAEPATKSALTEWEYKIDSPYDETFESSMNFMGRQGWELVSARRATSKYGSPKYEMIFKRPKD